MKVGIDLVCAKRFEALFEKQVFLNKNFTKYEVGYAEKKPNKAETLAGIFCAKEAFLKALGVGVLNGIALQDIQVVHNADKSPTLQVAKEILIKFGIKNIAISISHDAGFATAVCIIE